jgi:membrane protein YdbS with pleckstrin-like domain
VAPTPDERYRAASFRHRVLTFGALLLKVIVLTIPFWAVMVIRIWLEGHLDPNMRWFAILLVVAGAAVVVVGIVRAMRRRGGRRR